MFFVEINSFLGVYLLLDTINTLSTNEDIINHVGRVIRNESSTKVITYKVKIESENDSKEILLASIV